LKTGYDAGVMLLRSLLLALLTSLACAQTPPPLRLVIAGLAHGHVEGFLRAAKTRADLRIVGIYDADVALHKKYGRRHGLPDSLFSTDLPALLASVRPEAVAAFSSTYDHPAIVEACADQRIAVIMEKPLAVNNAHARRIARAAERSGIHVLVNYETTWYPSHGAIWKLFQQDRSPGEIRKMVAMDGHFGPKEIGVPPEFGNWLTDPEKNGAGALFDFGCYGANLMTWLMGNARPLAVTAVVQRIKPDLYPKVDDEATVLVEYPKAQGIIQGSWNWPMHRKDFEVYGQKGYAIATGPKGLRVRLPNQQEETRSPEALAADERDMISHLAAVVRGERKPGGLSSLENNLIVTEILDAARESARTGKRVVLRGR
jgi:predicted dehydrogenase